MSINFVNVLVVQGEGPQELHNSLVGSFLIKLNSSKGMVKGTDTYFPNFTMDK
jgi:hypothetical protein